MRYYMLNKPRGCITATEDARDATVMDLFPADVREGLFPVGRLDKDTEGFLLITDDGHLSCKLMMPHHHIPKTYLYYAIGTVTEEDRIRMETGVTFDTGYVTRPAKAQILGRHTLGDILDLLPERELKRAKKHLCSPVTEGVLTVTEGKKHQIKRMLRAVGCHVAVLRRVSIGDLSLDAFLAPGAYRPLTPEEVQVLYGDEPVPARPVRFSKETGTFVDAE